MTKRDNDDGDNKRGEGSSQKGEKRCFDLYATVLLAYGDDETRGRRGREEQERSMLMIHTITTTATTSNAFSLRKRKVDDDRDQCKAYTASSSSTTTSRSLSTVVGSKRPRVESNDEPIRAEPIRQIIPPVREVNRPVKKKTPVRREPVVTPEWVVDLMRGKGGEDAKMIFEKALTRTDLTPNQGRLLMPFKQMPDYRDFLTKAELKTLKEHHQAAEDVKKGLIKKGDDVKKGVDVILLHRSGEKKPWNLNMRIWEMRSSFNYALCSGWNQVVRDNKLQRNQTITLWSFHSHDGKLYFAFDPPTPHEEPFDCEEANRRIYPLFQKGRRTPRVCVGIITRDSSSNLLEGGFDLNRTPPEEMAPDLQAVQETHMVSTSQRRLTLDLELRF